MGEARVSIRSGCIGGVLAGSALLLMGAVDFKPPAVLAHRVSIAPVGQPGLRMIVTGRVVDARGRPRGAGLGDSFALYRPVKRDRAGVEYVVRDFRLR
jgi:hypothetical protein